MALLVVTGAATGGWGVSRGCLVGRSSCKSSCRHLRPLATNSEEDVTIYFSQLVLTLEPQPQGTGLLEAATFHVPACQESKGMGGGGRDGGDLEHSEVGLIWSPVWLYEMFASPVSPARNFLGLPSKSKSDPDSPEVEASTRSTSLLLVWPGLSHAEESGPFPPLTFLPSGLHDLP